MIDASARPGTPGESSRSTGHGLSDLEYLRALEDIKLLKARYFRYTDTKQMDLFRGLFAPGATALFHDIDTAARPIEEVLPALEAVVARCTTIHQGFLPEIEILSPTEATGIWAMQDRLYWTDPSPDGITEVLGHGHYHETYLHHRGTWKIKTLELTRLRLDVHSAPRALGGSASLLTARPPAG